MSKKKRYPKGYVKVLTCSKCGYQWIPRVENPAVCPNCKKYDY